MTQELPVLPKLWPIATCEHCKCNVWEDGICRSSNPPPGSCPLTLPNWRERLATPAPSMVMEEEVAKVLYKQIGGNLANHGLKLAEPWKLYIDCARAVLVLIRKRAPATCPKCRRTRNDWDCAEDVCPMAAIVDDKR